jgi:hypothetical protein
VIFAIQMLALLLVVTVIIPMLITAIMDRWHMRSIGRSEPPSEDKD